MKRGMGRRGMRDETPSLSSTPERGGDGEGEEEGREGCTRGARGYYGRLRTSLVPDSVERGRGLVSVEYVRHACMSGCFVCVSYESVIPCVHGK